MEAQQEFQATEEQVKESTDALLAEAAKRQPEDIAAEVFQMYLPVYRHIVGTLSNKDARRLCDALVSYPLEDMKGTFYSQEAKNAFELGKRLTDAKLIMRDFVIYEDAKQFLDTKKQEDGETNSPITETENEGEKQNG